MGKPQNNKGISLLVVLGALIVMGFLAMAMVKLSSGGQLSNVFYRSSASARAAAQSGMIAAIQKFEDTTSAVKDNNRVILQSWIDAARGTSANAATQWFLGDATNYVSMGTGTNQSYKVRIIGFDYERFNITLQAEGAGKGKSSATITAVYNLEGLGYGNIQSWDDGSALYIEDDIALNINAPIIVNGSIRLSQSTKFDGFASGSIFRGNFYTQSSSATMDFTGNYTFEKSAFFGTKPIFKRADMAIKTFQFNQKAGFPKGVLMQGGHVQLSSSSYWLQNPSKDNWGNDEIDFNSNEIVSTQNPFSSEPFCKEINSVQFKQNTFTEDSIKKELGLPLTQCQITVHPEVIPEANIIDIKSEERSTWTAHHFDSLATKYSDKIWNNRFFVVRVKPYVSIHQNKVICNSIILDGLDGGEIQKKFILLVDGENPNIISSKETLLDQPNKCMAVVQPIGVQLLNPATNANEGASKMFSVKIVEDATTHKVNKNTSGHFSIIAYNNAFVNAMGGWDSFRGLLYSKTSRFVIGGSENSAATGLHGAIYAKAPSSLAWWPKTQLGEKPDFYYDPTVFEDLAVTGQTVNGNAEFLERTNCPISSELDLSKLIFTKPITATLVSQSQ